MLTERAIARIGRGWLTRDDRNAWEQVRTDLLDDLADNDAVHRRARRALADPDAGNTVGTAVRVARAAARGGRRPALWRADGEAWTVSDVPLLDELVDLLGRDKAAESAEQAAERERDHEAEYAAGVLDLLEMRSEDSMDDEEQLRAQHMIYAEDLAERFLERDTRELAERAAADRDWTYRHVVVDEAQELSEMDWRVLMRRCPGRSFTVVGDLAQRRSAAGATSWAAMLEPYVPGRWVYRSLSVNYRTPAEIMTVAAALLAEFAPEVRPPESVRACGVQPWSRRVDRGRISLRHRRICPRRSGACWHQRRHRSAGRAGRRCRHRRPRAWSSTPSWWWSRNGSSPPDRAARPNFTSPSPAPPNASASCTATRCRRP